MTTPSSEHRGASWTVLRGPLTDREIRTVTGDLATARQLNVDHLGNRVIRLTDPARERVAVTVRWKPLPPQPPNTLCFLAEPPPTVEILIDRGTGAGAQIAGELHERVAAAVLPYTCGELDGIRNSMPLLGRYSTLNPAFAGWALIFRDHLLEHSVGFVLAMERAGIPPGWIYALDKGDRTYNRDRVRATFAARGYRTGVLDNAAINAPHDNAAALGGAEREINVFIDNAHADGRRVLVVDDGGLLARGYGHTSARRRADAALELTVSGIKRIAAAGPLAIPVLNMARSQIKTRLGYREIADSCLRRLRTVLPDRKLIGRSVLLVGYGTLGSRLASALRSLGCRLTVVDSDLPTLIEAAEAGNATYRTAADALRATDPFLIIGTTGETALTTNDIAHLADNTLLAPFATRDFSLLAEHAEDRTEIPGVGLRFRLNGGRHVTLLGDGRSLNLFEADSIPNQGYDAYRAGTLIAAAHLCANTDSIPPGLHTAPADQAIADAGLFEAYYDLHLAPHNVRHRLGPAARAAQSKRPVANACVVGYGVAGRLHTTILEDLGADLTIIDPKHQDLPKDRHRTFTSQVNELPASMADSIDLWSVCCPTKDHLPVLRAILAHQPAARILLEKPACRGHEIDIFTDILTRHPQARVLINDQYRHSRALSAFADLIHHIEPDAPISQITVTFTKDRTRDINTGRFIDRHYGVLGYEWLHMLAVLAGIVPVPMMDAYLASNPATSQLWATYDPRLFVAALTERTTLDQHEGAPLHLELTSSILGPSILLGKVPEPRPPWRHNIRPTDDRYRHLAVHAGTTDFALHLEPVTAPDGWQLDRHHHRLTAVRGGQTLHDEVLRDSPLETSIRHAISQLTSNSAPPVPDLTPLRRIAGLAHVLHTTAPHDVQSLWTDRVSA
jgi:S-adenosylhomocysteine hydrolase